MAVSQDVDWTYILKATQLLADTELLLEGQGYPPVLVQRGLDRARGAALKKTEPLSAAIRGQAFYEILAVELQEVESWCDGQKSFLEGVDILPEPS